jgi:N-acetyl-anhydromuramyl-L-alanine amidase AmpD
MAVATTTFIQARHYTKGRSNPIDVLVIHTMEAPEKPETAENVARWFAGSTAPQASAHYCIDNNSIVQSVKDTDVAWHAPGANHNGIGFEHAGFAAEGPKEWADAYSDQMLKLSAGLVAEKCKEYGIPAVWLREADLLAGRRGITGHAQVSRAFKKSTHTDPGNSFPIERYLGYVKQHLGGSQPDAHGHPQAVKAPPATIKSGAKGPMVTRLQKLLKQRGFDPGAADGAFGASTAKAVKQAQKAHGLNADGIVGPMTWHALESSA